MCQLTVVDTKDSKINEILMNYFLGVNSMSDNDGFGVVAKNGKVLKSAESANSYLAVGDKKEQLDKVLVDSGYAGIAHCRLATVKNSVKEENSHPFTIGNFTLMHNGSLADHRFSDEINSLFTDSGINKHLLIDTQRALVVIEHFFKNAGNKVSAKALQDAMQYFNGAFNYFILDSDDKNRVHIFKGVQRPLEAVHIVDEKGTPVGFIMNSRLPQLNVAIQLISALKPNWNCVLLGLPYKTHYYYDYGTYILYDNGKFEYDPDKKWAAPVKTTVNKTHYGGSYTTHRDTTADGANLSLMQNKAFLMATLLHKSAITMAELELVVYGALNMSFSEIDSHIYPVISDLLTSISEKFKSNETLEGIQTMLFGDMIDPTMEQVISAYSTNNISIPFHLMDLEETV